MSGARVTAVGMALAGLLGACVSEHVLGGEVVGSAGAAGVAGVAGAAGSGQGGAAPSSTVTACVPEGWETSAGVHERTVQVGGQTRSYRVWLPAGHDPCADSPVVVGLRGEAAFLTEELSPKSVFLARAQQEGMAVLLPEATQVGARAQWNAPLAPLLVQDVDDVGFVATMLGEFPHRDADRTYLVGHGNGGTFAHTLAAQLPVFSAVAVVAGTLGGRRSPNAPLEVPPTPSSPVPILMMHGRDDAELPFAGGIVGNDVILAFSDAVDFWTAANGCPASFDTNVSDIYNVRRYTCPASNDVLAVSITGVGHFWSEDKVSLRMWTADSIFRFFVEYPR